ncbi:hypothetical protein F2Q69_00037118 [Brassica cretica]|uniref:Uncharacterized protein n=1 Tax=Brassica cretica TaxID=69181 RepID=A0A8S9SK81_BRACR|nr:hypothetical protein F2Q69_00037118 [Brassica cretica]
MATVDRCCSVSFNRRRVFCLVFHSTVASCNDSWIIDFSRGRLLHTAPTIDKKSLPSNREEFQFSLMSRTWKSTGTRALPICTSRFLSVGTLSTSIESSPSSEGILTVSGRLSEGLGLGLSPLRRATSIFGICTRYVIGAHRSIEAGGCRSMSTSVCRSMGVAACRAILTLSGLGRCGCFAANSPGPLIDVHGLGSIDTSAIRRSSSDFLLRNLLLAASLPSPLARNHPQ